MSTSEFTGVHPCTWFSSPVGTMFGEPVDRKRFPDYYTIVKNPIDIRYFLMKWGHNFEMFEILNVIISRCVFAAPYRLACTNECTSMPKHSRPKFTLCSRSSAHALVTDGWENRRELYTCVYAVPAFWGYCYCFVYFGIRRIVTNITRGPSSGKSRATSPLEWKNILTRGLSA